MPTLFALALQKNTVVSSDNESSTLCLEVGVHVDINNENNENQTVTDDDVVDAFEQAGEQETDGTLETVSDESVVSDDAAGDEQVSEDNADDQVDWSNVPDSFRSQLEEAQLQNAQLLTSNDKLKNDVRASNGRLRAAQKAAKKVREDNPVKDIDIDSFESDELKEIREEFPEINGGFKQLADAVNHNVNVSAKATDAMIDSLDESYAEVEQQELTAYEDEQLGSLAEKHPDYLNINASLEFAQWLDSQLPGVQAMQRSSHGSDLIHVFDLYQEQQQRKSSEQKSKDDLLAEHTEIPRKGSGRAVSDSDDSNEIFASFF